MHFDSVLTENPVPEAGDFFKWSVDVHNIVNKRLGKPDFSYEDALANIVMMDAPTPSTSQFDFKIALILVLMVIILVLIFNRK